MDILGPDGAAALAAAEAEADPSSLAAAERLRRRFPPALAAEALTQTALRRRAGAKFRHPTSVLLTAAGLEQATRHPVAAWRAGRFAAAGVAEVWDLGCGLGADALALQAAGLRVVGVEADPVTAAYAGANLGSPVVVGRAEDARPPSGAGVFLDPARRTGAGRTWNVSDFQPPWDLVTGYLASDRFVCVKLGPGLPKEMIPPGVLATWVSHRGDVVEVSLWNQVRQGRSAVVFGARDADPVAVHADPGVAPLPVAGLGRYVLEPDNAIIRAGVVAEAALGTGAWLLADDIAYLSADRPTGPGLFDCFEVLEVLPFDVGAIRRYLTAEGIGIVEVKKRAVDVDPAELRRRLRPRGSRAVTLLLGRTTEGTRAIVTRRVRQ